MESPELVQFKHHVEALFEKHFGAERYIYFHIDLLGLDRKAIEIADNKPEAIIREMRTHGNPPEEVALRTLLILCDNALERGFKPDSGSVRRLQKLANALRSEGFNKGYWETTPRTFDSATKNTSSSISHRESNSPVSGVYFGVAWILVLIYYLLPLIGLIGLIMLIVHMMK